MLLVDTNVFVYAADRAFPEHERCRSLLDRLRSQPVPWYTTWPIVYEFISVVTHRRFGPRTWNARDAWRFVESLLTSPSLTVLCQTDRHSLVARQVLEGLPSLRGPILHDAHTAILMREHGVGRILTRDTDFHKFPFVEVVDPLSETYEPGAGTGGALREPRPARVKSRRPRARASTGR